MLNTVFLKDKTKFTKRNVSILHSVMENEFKQDKRKSFSNKLSSPNAKEDDYPKSERLLGLDQDTSIILNENEFEEKKTQKKKSPKKEKIIKIENSEILKKEKRNMIFSSLIAKALDDEKKK